MRLINAKTFEMKEFFGSAIPKYAILSHRWAEDEVSLYEMTRLTPEVKGKKGFGKIALTCEQAIKDDLEWAWVDTCCIDKTSSSELSEAINSMFQWYEESSICYAYLIDVPAVTVFVQEPENATHWWSNVTDGWLTATRPNFEAFSKSSWLTRGWTLQELIAPSHVVFYGEGWSHLGTRRELSILLALFTRIPRDVLDFDIRQFLKPREHNAYSVAQKMSWVANRECTRVEDVAYCLLGLFDINMPLLYGEGQRAFTRLQEEIFRSTDDHSLLAWSMPQSPHHYHTNPPEWTLTSVLAWSPACFESCEHIVRLHEEPAEPSAMTKKGIRAYIPIEEESDHAAWNIPRKHCQVRTFRAVLNSAKETGEQHYKQRICLLLVQNDASNQGFSSHWPKSYSRLLTPGHLFVASERFKSEEPIQDPDNDIYRTIFLSLRPQDFRGPDFSQQPTTAAEPINFYVEGLPWELHSDFSEPLTPPQHMSSQTTFGYMIANRSFSTFEGYYLDTPRIQRLDAGRDAVERIEFPVWNTTNARGVTCFSPTGHTLFRVNVANTLGREGFSVLCQISRRQRNRRQRNTLGSFTMEIRPAQEAGRLAHISGLANIEDINGMFADLDLVLGDVIVSAELLAAQSWAYPRGTVPDASGQRLHVLLRLTFRAASSQGFRSSRALQRFDYSVLRRIQKEVKKSEFRDWLIAEMEDVPSHIMIEDTASVELAM
jgi:hypothetical protein